VEYINKLGEGIKERKHWNQMTDKEKFIDICEGTFIRNPAGTNYFSDGSLRTIMYLQTSLLKHVKHENLK
jgi:hypothetical protein